MYKEVAKIIIICSWCKNVMGAKEPYGKHSEVITHGICSTCKEEFESEATGEADRIADNIKSVWKHQRSEAE